MADVSVVIPCYNGQEYIGEAIESVLAQTDPPHEVFVIDDGSTDDSVSVIERFTNPSGPSNTVKITLIRQTNSGESRARNVGLKHATCKYVAFLDADDLWLLEKNARQLEAFAQFPEAVGVYSRVFNFEHDLEDHSRNETEATKDNPSVEDLINYHYVSPSAAMVRRDVLQEHGLRFDESIQHSEDMLFFADVRLTGTIRLIDEPLTAKRIHSAQQTKDRWHTIYSLESRVGWCRHRADVLGRELFEKLDAMLGKRMVDTLEDRFWRREMEDFKANRKRVERLFPDLVANNKIVNRRIYPLWVYRLRDTLFNH